MRKISIFLLLIFLIGCNSVKTVEPEIRQDIPKKSKPEISFKYDLAPIVSKNIISQVETREYAASRYNAEIESLRKFNDGLKTYMIRARSDLLQFIDEAKTADEIKNCIDLQTNLETSEMAILHTDLLIKELRQKANALKFNE